MCTGESSLHTWGTTASTGETQGVTTAGLHCFFCFCWGPSSLELGFINSFLTVALPTSQAMVLNCLNCFTKQGVLPFTVFF